MKKLYEIVQNLKGNVLIIGVEEEAIIQKIEENLNIQTCHFLNANTKKKETINTNQKKQNFKIKNLRKKFKKKKIDDILCNVKDIYPYFKTFVKDSVYINKGNLYLYGETDKYELERVIQKYQKYHATVTKKIEGTYFFITISNEKSKPSKWKDLYFRVTDFFVWLYDLIGEILIN